MKVEYKEGRMSMFRVKIEGKYGSADLSEIPDSGAYGICNISQKCWWFSRLWVHPSLRNIGVATELMWEVCKWADRKGFWIICLPNATGDMSDSELRKFYRSFGFTDTSTEERLLCRRSNVQNRT